MLIPVFYSEQVAAPDQGASPSAHKPSKVVQDWIAERFPIKLVAPLPVTRDDLSRAHDRQYVDDVLALRGVNGFGNRSASVAASLPFTTGAMLQAARAALANGRVAVAPVSGFHHAGYEHAHGFCTFNGLMVTACVLRAEGLAHRVGILDFDQHYGDGTDDIISNLGADWVTHITAGARWTRRQDARVFLDAIPRLVSSLRQCDLILYQAGADPHVRDPLGGWLTTEELYERDYLVFDAAARLGIPVAWNLAGGYQRSADGGIGPVLRIHRNTMFACARIYSEQADRFRAATDRSVSLPHVWPSELRFDPDHPLSPSAQRNLALRMKLHERCTGDAVFFPDLTRLPVDLANFVDRDES